MIASTQNPMICLHIPGAVDAGLAAAAAAEMRAHFARVEPTRSAAKFDEVQGFAQPLRSLVAYVHGAAPAGARRPEFVPGAAVRQLLEAVTSVFAAQLPEEFSRQARFPQEPEPQAFSTLTVNRNWATPLHRDCGTRAGSVVALVIVKEGAVACPTVIEGQESRDLESGDLLLFQGAELEHGNPNGIAGAGTRWAFVLYQN
jgi:hypothetical protein